jgi:hypothetical protein
MPGVDTSKPTFAGAWRDDVDASREAFRQGAARRMKGAAAGIKSRLRRRAEIVVAAIANHRVILHEVKTAVSRLGNGALFPIMQPMDNLPGTRSVASSRGAIHARVGCPAGDAKAFRSGSQAR